MTKKNKEVRGKKEKNSRDGGRKGKRKGQREEEKRSNLHDIEE